MTREQIEKEIDARLDEPDNEWDGIFNSGYSRGFRDGAQWRINSVWHDMGTEVPQIYGDYGDLIYPQIPCLVVGYLSTGYGYGVRYWNVTEQCWDDEECDDYECDKDKIEEWAYLDDLLPERKEETE